ncbi:lipocalin-like domain-containing protein [Shewanella litorisediminis]|uniref:Carotenoid 1,2-hydratase n=1 Tax=Shewanella litorisediminis TaxID=1173586 RepID=A0ABX7G1T7_9GAMM|nr:lipocalin-like domain-containing protein [Shewanella litorisediminis]MCL2920006.1 carotenoid 1,2-hydratase [Shewanella litorisediminis]QRH01192.1 carotenoid 1,2-hydratase [Shewanella litorisediminis]
MTLAIKIKLLPLMALVLLLAAGCDKTGDNQRHPAAATSDTAAPGMGELMAGDLAGFDKVIRGKALTFPADHGPHNHFRQEWWYLTANLKTAGGEPLGLQWTQFRVALKPEPEAAEQAGASNSEATGQNASEGSWQSRQLWFAHAAVTRQHSHVATEQWSRGHRQLAAAGGKPFSVHLANWRWQSQTDALFPASLTVEAVKGEASPAYRLTLSSQSPLQLQGDRGYSAKSFDAGLASYYYSAPFIDIEGEVLLDGVWQKVSGQGWLDREWSSAFLGLAQQGWDWFALRLDDGSALMLFQLREQNATSFTHANRMWPDGRSQQLEVISITPNEYRQGYPVTWQLSLKDSLAGNPEASGQINLKVEALNGDARMQLSMPYWEGPVEVSGSFSGEGYMELTGY